MKLRAIQDRAGEGQAKRAGDAWDIHQLLAHHNRTGEITRSIQQAPEALRDAVQAAARGVLVGPLNSRPRLAHGAGGPRPPPQPQRSSYSASSYSASSDAPARAAVGVDHEAIQVLEEAWHGTFSGSPGGPNVARNVARGKKKPPAIAPDLRF